MEYGSGKKINAYGFLLQCACIKLELKTSELWFSRASHNIENGLLDKRYDLSDLRMAVNIRSSQFVDLLEFSWNSYFTCMT